MLSSRGIAPRVNRRPTASVQAFLNLQNLLGGQKMSSAKGSARRSELKAEVRAAERPAPGRSRAKWRTAHHQSHHGP
jgi:hypothetical protein